MYTKATQALPTYHASEKLLVYRRVKVSTGTENNKPPSVEYADVGEADIGQSETLVEADGYIAVRPAGDLGRHAMVSDGAFIAGSILYGSVDGKVGTTVEGNPVGKAYQASTSADEIVAVERVY